MLNYKRGQLIYILICMLTMFFHNLWSKHNKLYYSSFYGCDLKKLILKKITFSCGWARQNIFLVKIVV